MLLNALLNSVDTERGAQKENLNRKREDLEAFENWGKRRKKNKRGIEKESGEKKE